ncbi:MAG: hypothetical protein LQ342_004345 [Letrouitia transgressa]|nr:MAG: hypothetical protein LQ342_004345 [Letrouitia transgressa]
MSSNKTATRWFVSDKDFDAADEDYAIVFERSADARVEFRSHDDGYWRQRPRSFGEIADETNCYLLAWKGRLLYADVDEAADPEHLKSIEKAREELLKEEAPGTEEARKGLVAHYLEESKKHDDNEDYGYNFEPLFPNRRNKIEGFKGEIGIGPCVEYCLLQDVKTRKILLNLLTRQARRKSPRPVLLLLGMIDNRQSTLWGRTEGFASAYDFETDEIISAPAPMTGLVSAVPRFNSSSASSNSRNPWGGDAKDLKDLGFKMMTYHHIALFVITWWNILAKNPDLAAGEETFTETKLEELKTAQAQVAEVMKKTKFPKQDKRVESVEQSSVNFFKKLRDKLERHENTIRSDALEAKYEGKEELAMSIAGFYEKLTSQLNDFIKNPTNKE